MTDMPEVSKSLREVWEWKDAAYREVALLPRRLALATLLDNAERAAQAIGLDLPPLSPPPARMVAEDGCDYQVRAQSKQT
jgi:hypothetical protein